MSIKVAVCQVPDIRENIDTSLKWIEKLTTEAEEKDVSLICFPECFLQGYITEKFAAQKTAVNLRAQGFTKILNQLSKYKPMIVFGLIEEENMNLFNTAVLIREGLLIGKYRKAHLVDGEKVFTLALNIRYLKLMVSCLVLLFVMIHNFLNQQPRWRQRALNWYCAFPTL